MSGRFDSDWAEAVCNVCDPVFAAADVGFTRQVQVGEGRDDVASLLWEADPGRFAARYPDSGIVESYGRENWAGVHCIDYWVYVDHDARQARLSLEGWSLTDEVLDLTADGVRDGRVIGNAVARILRVAPPQPGL